MDDFFVGIFFLMLHFLAIWKQQQSSRHRCFQSRGWGILFCQNRTKEQSSEALSKATASFEAQFGEIQA